MKYIKILFLILTINISFAQDVALYQQFNGRFDFTFVGNTLNVGENNITPGCTLLTSASATLTLTPNDVIEKVFLYWAGSGTGDIDIKLNNIDVVASRQFSLVQTTFNLNFFSAFADVTNIVATTGNGIYTVSDLDLNSFLTPTQYCNNRTNFGGWAMVVVYKNANLPLNQLNVYDGLQGIPQAVNITLSSLNVIDDVGAKIGFLAWEGDSSLSVNETLRVNNNILSNALNPANNAFNSTNSVTGETNLYNMDMDIYNIQNNIAIGDTSASVQMTSGQDFVMINTIITKLNSQLPDATIVIDGIEKSCNSRNVKINYTVRNFECTNILPANVPVSVYANGLWVGNTFTTSALAIGASENGSIIVTIPAVIPNNFEITIRVDNNQQGLGTVNEILENNNSNFTNIGLITSPTFNKLLDLTSCNLGLTKGIFDFSDYEAKVKTNPIHEVRFFETIVDANSNLNPIFGLSNFTALATPKNIYVRVTNNDGCFSVTTFKLLTENCPPKVYNFVSANQVTFNDIFFVEGLRDIFINHETFIYNRWGQLVWLGNNNISDFVGIANKGIKIIGQNLPEGTYYYVLELNDPNYPKPLNGYLYLTR